jgi:hypothetical protein
MNFVEPVISRFLLTSSLRLISAILYTATALMKIVPHKMYCSTHKPKYGWLCNLAVFSIVIFFFSFLGVGFLTSATNWPIVPAPDDR